MERKKIAVILEECLFEDEPQVWTDEEVLNQCKGGYSSIGLKERRDGVIPMLPTPTPISSPTPPSISVTPASNIAANPTIQLQASVETRAIVEMLEQPQALQPEAAATTLTPTPTTTPNPTAPKFTPPPPVFKDTSSARALTDLKKYYYDFKDKFCGEECP